MSVFTSLRCPEFALLPGEKVQTAYINIITCMLVLMYPYQLLHDLILTLHGLMHNVLRTQKKDPCTVHAQVTSVSAHHRINTIWQFCMGTKLHCTYYIALLLSYIDHFNRTLILFDSWLDTQVSDWKKKWVMRLSNRYNRCLAVSRNSHNQFVCLMLKAKMDWADRLLLD